MQRIELRVIRVADNVQSAISEVAQAVDAANNKQCGECWIHMASLFVYLSGIAMTVLMVVPSNSNRFVPQLVLLIVTGASVICHWAVRLCNTQSYSCASYVSTIIFQAVGIGYSFVLLQLRREF